MRSLFPKAFLAAWIAAGVLWAGTLPQFAQKPRILHRDDRLVGEVLQQSDLLVGKRRDLPAENGDQPEHDTFFA